MTGSLQHRLSSSRVDEQRETITAQADELNMLPPMNEQGYQATLAIDGHSSRSSWCHVPRDLQIRQFAVLPRLYALLANKGDFRPMREGGATVEGHTPEESHREVRGPPPEAAQFAPSTKFRHNSHTPTLLITSDDGEHEQRPPSQASPAQRNRSSIQHNMPAQNPLFRRIRESKSHPRRRAQQPDRPLAQPFQPSPLRKSFGPSDFSSGSSQQDESPTADAADAELYTEADGTVMKAAQTGRAHGVGMNGETQEARLKRKQLKARRENKNERVEVAGAGQIQRPRAATATPPAPFTENQYIEQSLATATHTAAQPTLPMQAADGHWYFLIPMASSAQPQDGNHSAATQTTGDSQGADESSIPVKRTASERRSSPESGSDFASGEEARRAVRRRRVNEYGQGDDVDIIKPSMPVTAPQETQQNDGRAVGAAPSFEAPPQVSPQATLLNAVPPQTVMPSWQANQVPSQYGPHAPGVIQTATHQPLSQEQPTYYLPKWPEMVGRLVPPTVMPWLYETLPNKQNFVPVYGEPPPTIVVRQAMSYGINRPPDAYRSVGQELWPLYRRTDFNANSASHVAIGPSASNPAGAEVPPRNVEVLPRRPSDVEANAAPGEQAEMTKSSARVSSPPREHRMQEPAGRAPAGRHPYENLFTEQ
ncbi:hypothetical protein Tdes44962_MAKER05955 [Teratosphaeria destructans]|uniref:Uncharacterized protein n=1 Tax=Teratosphaeria destructans TaxID=418781 RepID=A0A9W7SIN3_9PEZI|nr:hypothetical protein Tdes44962_MAKER05955 [Teratosphaeria destructans]